MLFFSCFFFFFTFLLSSFFFCCCCVSYNNLSYVYDLHAKIKMREWLSIFLFFFLLFWLLLWLLIVVVVSTELRKKTFPTSVSEDRRNTTITLRTEAQPHAPQHCTHCDGGGRICALDIDFFTAWVARRMLCFNNRNASCTCFEFFISMSSNRER